jgi:hypothetical protein
LPDFGSVVVTAGAGTVNIWINIAFLSAEYLSRPGMLTSACRN